MRFHAVLQPFLVGTCLMTLSMVVSCRGDTADQSGDMPGSQAPAVVETTTEGQSDVNPAQEPAAPTRPVHRVHVIANESVITGTVLDHDVVSSTLLGISPAMSIYRIDVRVEMSEEVEGMPSAMMYKEGGVLQLHSKKELPSNLLNKSVKARVSYAGDERGGRFWVDELERVDSAEEEK